MSFFIPTAHKCPIAKNSQGLIEIDPIIIGKLAGAVHEPDEWLVILLGTKSQGGLHVIVEGIYVPFNQKRTSGTCEVEKLPPELNPHIVGALHSHHKMGAKFSGTYGGEYGDRGKGGLNVTFPMSIVISSSYSSRDEEAALLGFNYEAELTHEGPCGGLLRSPARIIPRGEEDWPFPWEVINAPTEGRHKSLEDCHLYSEASDSTRYSYRREAGCGLEEEDTLIRASVFGFDYQSIVSQLPKKYEPPPSKKDKRRGDQRVRVVDSHYKSEQDLKDEADFDRWINGETDDYLYYYQSER